MQKNQVISSIINFLENSSGDERKPLLVLHGPTASGKTALSLEVAKRFNGEIVSADSRQVYRYMDIGTDKIHPKKRGGIPHYLIDVVDPEKRFTVVDFKKLAEEKIDDILSRGKLPMLVGGTGLYINAITENFSPPPEDSRIRAQLIKELEDNGSAQLYEKLQKLDPLNASKIHPHNIPYIVRALEIFMITGKSKNDQQNPLRYKCLKMGLSWPHEVLFKRIDKRVDEQIERGLIEEVKKLLAMGYSKNSQPMRSLGYQEVINYIEGTLSLRDATALIKKNTRNFAKRQMTWFKRDREIIWIENS